MFIDLCHSKLNQQTVRKKAKLNKQTKAKRERMLPAGLAPRAMFDPRPSVGAM
jgi:hypothetical protein